jgi:DNA polymerase-1
MLLQVHDELVFEVPEDNVESIRSEILGLMRNAVQMRVPLEVASGVGKNWFECK